MVEEAEDHQTSLDSLQTRYDTQTWVQDSPAGSKHSAPTRRCSRPFILLLLTMQRAYALLCTPSDPTRARLLMLPLAHELSTAASSSAPPLPESPRRGHYPLPNHTTTPAFPARSRSSPLHSHQRPH